MIKKRNMIGQIGLVIITLGIYAIYWFYKISEEMKFVGKDAEASPGLWTVLLFLARLRRLPRRIESKKSLRIDWCWTPAFAGVTGHGMTLLRHPRKRESLEPCMDPRLRGDDSTSLISASGMRTN